MGRVIAFPDTKSCFHNLPAQDGNSQGVNSCDYQDNVILFSGVFVEYHENSQNDLRNDALCADSRRVTNGHRGQAGWGSQEQSKQAENCGPEKSPRLNQR